MVLSDLEERIVAVERRCSGEFSPEDKQAILRAIEALDSGELRVAEPPKDGGDAGSGDWCGDWKVRSWLKQAILYYFQISQMRSEQVGPYHYHDKIPLKTNYSELKVRVVPPATARRGSFMEPGVVLMPSYVNIGAYVGADSMVDTWATVGSCAQVGRRVHLSGGVGLGGVLEPPSALPVIIEDGAFIGSRCIIVEGTRVCRGAVIAAGVTLTASTPIYDLRCTPVVVHKGIVPERAVVVSGVREKEMPAGKILIGCAYIIGERRASTDEKTSLNEVLREHALSV